MDLRLDEDKSGVSRVVFILHDALSEAAFTSNHLLRQCDRMKKLLGTKVNAKDVPGIENLVIQANHKKEKSKSNINHRPMSNIDSRPTISESKSMESSRHDSFGKEAKILSDLDRALRFARNAKISSVSRKSCFNSKGVDSYSKSMAPFFSHRKLVKKDASTCTLGLQRTLSSDFKCLKYQNKNNLKTKQKLRSSTPAPLINHLHNKPAKIPPIQKHKFVKMDLSTSCSDTHQPFNTQELDILMKTVYIAAECNLMDLASDDQSDLNSIEITHGKEMSLLASRQKEADKPVKNSNKDQPAESHQYPSKNGGHIYEMKEDSYDKFMFLCQISFHDALLGATKPSHLVRFFQLQHELLDSPTQMRCNGSSNFLARLSKQEDANACRCSPDQILLTSLCQLLSIAQNKSMTRSEIYLDLRNLEKVLKNLSDGSLKFHPKFPLPRKTLFRKRNETEQSYVQSNLRSYGIWNFNCLDKILDLDKNPCVIYSTKTELLYNQKTIQKFQWLALQDAVLDAVVLGTSRNCEIWAANTIKIVLSILNKY